MTSSTPSSRCWTRRCRAASPRSAQMPAFAGVDVVSKYVARLRLKAPDARVFGFLAWGRYSPIVPAGLYDQINVTRNAIGTGPVPDGRLQPERPRRVRGQQGLLEEGPAVHGRDDAEDAPRRAGPHRGPARRRDRRRHRLHRRRQRPQERQQPRRAQGRHGGVPRAAVHDQGRSEAVARHPRPPGGQPRDQPAGDHQHRLQRQRQLLRHRPARVRPVAAHAGRAEDRSTRSSIS